MREQQADTILIPDLYRATAKGKPDWGKLTGDARFYGAILKALEGTSFPPGEAWFAEQWPAVRAAGGARYGSTWFRGAYHYLILRGGDAASGTAQAEAYLRTVEKAGGWGIGDLPAIADVELGSDKSANRGASKQQVIDVASAWAVKVRAELGGPVILYGRGAMRDLGITSQMSFDFLWAPQYNYKLDPTDRIGWPAAQVKLWQYTDGTASYAKLPIAAPGIGPCDLSKFLGSLDELRALARAAHPLL